MTKIRNLYYFDKKNAQEMISFLNNGDKYVNRIMFNPFMPFHHLIPIRFKFLPESYVLKDNREIKGLITIAPTRCPMKQMEIQKLLFEENCYENACELIQYVVSKYKAKGAASIIVRVDDYLPELVKLFVSKCGFSQISYEKLWRINTKDTNDKSEFDIDYYKSMFNQKMFREFRNSDAPVVANMYNEQLLPHFRPLLGKDVKEFKDVVFAGISYFAEYKYVYRNKKSKNILAFLSLKTSDNENYILDIIKTSWDEISLDELIAFSYYQIKKRKKNAKLFIKSKKYTQQGEANEKDFMERKFECLQNKIILTNSSAKIIKDEEHAKKFTVLNQFYGGVSVTNKAKIKIKI